MMPSLATVHKLSTIPEKLKIPLEKIIPFEESSDDSDLKKCDEAIKNKQGQMWTEILKTYYCPTISHSYSVFRDALHDSGFSQWHLKTKNFFEDYINAINKIFEPKSEADENKDEDEVEMCSLLSYQQYNKITPKVKESIMKLDEEKIKNSIRKLYPNDHKIFKDPNYDLYLKKDVKLFKLLLAKTITEGLQNNDYSYFTVEINDDLVQKIIAKIADDKNCKNGKIKSLTNYYKKAVIEYQQEHFEQFGILKQDVVDQDLNQTVGTLIRIPKTKFNSCFYKERFQVVQTHSYRGWCTHTNLATTIIQGDFLIYIPTAEKKSPLGFRYENGKIVEIEDAKNTREIKDVAKPVIKLLNTETGKTLIKDLSLNILLQLNKTAPAEDKAKLTTIKNIYCAELTTQIENAENTKKITEILSLTDLETLNSLYKKDEKPESLNALNKAYFEALRTQIQKAENEGKKITDVLSAYDLKYLNRLYKQENKPESLNALNITYLTTLLAQNIEDVCGEDDLEILNLVCQSSQDQQIQDLLRQINAKMESAQG